MLVDVPLQEGVDETEEAERIEVHVHVHREAGPGSRSKRRAPPLSFTGSLFDWQGHYDPICKRPPPTKHKRWSRLANCQSCDATVLSISNRCPRCAAPRSPRLFSRMLGALGLGIVVAVFALCAHLLGSSVAEQQAPGPLGKWSDDDGYQVVEVPVTPSPFSYGQAPANGSLASGDGLAKR